MASLPGFNSLQSLLGSTKSNIGSFFPAKNAIPAGASVSQSNQSFADQNVANPVAASTGANVQASQNSLMSLLNNPANNSGINAAYNSYLAAARPGEEQGYQDLADAFRNAGAMQDGSYGIALGKYASGIDSAHTQAFGDAVKSVLPTLASGYESLATQGPTLLDALKMGNSSSISAGQGVGGGMGVAQGSVPGAPITTAADLSTYAGNPSAYGYRTGIASKGGAAY